MFKVWLPAQKPRQFERNAGKFRTSARLRGYDARWDRLSTWFRKRNPFCLFCQQEGREGLTAVSDHVLPWFDFPSLRYEPSNLIPLCDHHHNYTKQKMESYARRYGKLEELPFWCAKLENRPAQFRPGGI